MKKTERLVYYYELSIKATSKTFEVPKPISVRKAFGLMDSMRHNWPGKRMYNGREHVYISDWAREEDVISILVNKSDKNVPDPVFTSPSEKKRRTVEKDEKEGQDFSAHLLIQFPKDDCGPALVLVEHCIGLSTSVIKKVLNQLLKDAKSLFPSEFKQLHPDGSLNDDNKPKEYDVMFNFEFAGRVSDDLQYDLNNGKINTVELITERKKSTLFDEDEMFVEKRSVVVLAVKKEGRLIKNLLTSISNIFKKDYDKYSHAVIKFKSPTGVNRSIKLDVSSIEDMEKVYVKREKLNDFDVDLKSSYDRFNNDILDKMKSLLP